QKVATIADLVDQKIDKLFGRKVMSGRFKLIIAIRCTDTPAFFPGMGRLIAYSFGVMYQIIFCRKVVSVYAPALFTPAVVHHHGLPDRRLVVQPSQELRAFQLLTWIVPFTVGKDNFRTVCIY